MAIGQNSRSGTYTLFLTQGIEIELIFVQLAAVFRDPGRFSYLGMNSRSFTYTLFLPQEVEIELIFALRAAVSEIRANITIAIFGHETWQVAKVAHTRSTPGSQNLAYFCSTDSSFQDTGQFSNLPYLAMKLGKCPQFQKLHMDDLSTPEGRN